MLASPLTPAVRLVLLVAAEDITSRLDVPFDVAGLSRRLGMAPSTIREHRDAARLAGWLSHEQTIRPARGRPAHYAAVTVTGQARSAGRKPGSTVPVAPAPLSAVAPAPSTVDGAGATGTVSRGKSGNGAGAAGTVPIETPDQDEPWAAGAHHPETAAAQTKDAATKNDNDGRSHLGRALAAAPITGRPA
jgi:hypothetical protein